MYPCRSSINLGGLLLSGIDWVANPPIRLPNERQSLLNTPDTFLGKPSFVISIASAWDSVITIFSIWWFTMSWLNSTGLETFQSDLSDFPCILEMIDTNLYYLNECTVLFFGLSRMIVYGCDVIFPYFVWANKRRRLVIWAGYIRVPMPYHLVCSNMLLKVIRSSWDSTAKAFRLDPKSSPTSWVKFLLSTFT